MGLGPLLVPALAGYWFITHWNYVKYGAARSSGYHVLFQAGLAGAVLFGLAEGLLLLLYGWIPQAEELWHKYIPGLYADTVTLAIVLGFALPFLLNYIYSEKQGARRAAESRGDLIELLIIRATEEQRNIQVSLKSGRVYVGSPTDKPTSVGDDSDISLLPFASGYRDKNTQELQLTTFYASIMQERSEQQRDTDDLRVVIPLSEVITARLWDQEVHNVFQGITLPPPVREPSPGANSPSAGN